MTEQLTDNVGYWSRVCCV